MSEPTDRAAEIAAALASVRERLARACADAGREDSTVTLLPVTKFFPASDVRILYELGCREFGESREQDASPKVAETAEDFRGDPPRWHMIGHLQRNKAKSIAAWAHSIHSVDSARLVTALSKATETALDDGARTTPLDVLVQVSLDGDVHRGGVERGDLYELADAVSTAPGLRLAGLMAVPPLDADADAAFGDLQVLHQRLLRDHPDARELSAGMTGDLEAAVRHGSTCVRVGTAILGARPIASQ
ncbi:YggS family pyridoxal phosphate-dependent enzyme [Rhodococcus sp. 05-2256-B2]|uniref:YggS family pyridoxal phosphate-dependent enzyme n=1 Tax=unclassified Rhodococcus (in: high G+C Gram-positive bacteria) TaxID=192944 RepID=UPI000B9B5FE1|nr:MULTISPECIES: YggS family pyridoxal phosphate-dependent enzyme [unclassified Rhodococcus (in: high G+C Gram-positive bacteria)]OZD76976.1 YggS family pyridoxal phosphate-dependent enzyme [Rhodococcus sp. 05-2256-B4]OZD88095.1 YggS family pyridoxal phosphate-dependent enzyme [Rhodococcus sp. 05-2256-B3]OZD98227.1 YggS family pyridoxal phosphate-dependent enzyme [Rhodococcus sp. 05-2256-B2]OZE01410.1 YggS family pyridoxal phosphate-dependent enzyme [Rhodococcus sp. 05-2256-B1]